MLKRNSQPIDAKLLAEWHPTKNGELDPRNLASKSDRTIWWMCAKGHEWQSTVKNRTNGLACRQCLDNLDENNLVILFPEIAKEWHPTKNKGLDPHKLKPQSGRRVWWRCAQGHEWESSIQKRTLRGTSCQYCSGKKPSPERNLSTAFPKLANQWHPTRNGHLTPQDVAPHSNKKLWWVCDKGHEWETSPSKRSNGNGCPYCSNRIVGSDNNLAVVRPDIAQEWHPHRNGNLRPQNILPCSNRKVWWMCDKGHTWEALISNRTNPLIGGGTSCPCCSKRISKPGVFWLDNLGVTTREFLVKTGKRRFFVDGLDPQTRTVYEFLGDYWHGNPQLYKSKDMNPSVHKTFGELFRQTMEKFRLLSEAGYTIVYRWESSDANELFIL